MRKSLRQQLKETEDETKKYRNLYYEKCNKVESLERTIKELNNLEGKLMRSQENMLRSQIEDMKDIIRWLIKPETASIKGVKDFPRFR
jgi:ppGpp synthetase/RelA/SpoT-type nucleotidyltranferase